LLKSGRLSIVAGALLVALVALYCVVQIPAEAMTGQQPPPRSVTAVDAPVASKLRQLDALKRDIEKAGCEFAADDASIEGCQQLDGKARGLEAEIDELKIRAGWTVEKQKAVEAGGLHAPPQPPEPYTYRLRTNPGAVYRTVCARLCDGFYYPVNEAARPGSFLAEEMMCQSTCSVPARLFYQKLPAGDGAGEMVSLTGERYADLPNAFRYRSEYLNACACGPKPWSAEAKAQYERRATLATRTRVERIVAAGAGNMAKQLAAAALQVAQRPPRVRDAAARVKVEQYRGLFGRLRAMRHGAQARNDQPQRRFFLFRSR
jgi:Protein of unknown function (DUF2865)